MNNSLGLVAYVPVVSRGYLEFFESNKHADLLAVADSTLLDGIREIEKDLRALRPEICAQALSSILDVIVRPIGQSALRAFIEEGGKLLLPDDEVSENIINLLELNSENYDLLPVFLRWNRKNITIDSPVREDYSISIDEINSEVLKLLKIEHRHATDWWRQVAAVVVSESDILSSRNRYVPTEFDAEILGDIRSNSKRGVRSDVLNSIHAEQSVIATAARRGIVLDKGELYTTTFPCPSCAKLCVEAGIKKVYFIEGYAQADGETILKSAGVKIIRLILNNEVDFNELSRTKSVNY